MNPKMSIDVHSWHLFLDHVQFTLIHRPNIPGSYAILLFTASDFIYITSRYIHNWASFLLWSILSGAISNCPPLFPSSMLDIFQPGGLIFRHHIFCFFIMFMGFLGAWILEWFAIPSSSGSRFVRTQPLWPVHLGWPYTAWLTASLSYVSPFTTTRQWSVKAMACCSSSCCKELDTTGWLNNNNSIYIKT